MAYQNEDYNPDWKMVHDRHAPKRDQAQAETNRLIGAGKMNTPAYDEAKADFDWHSKACRDAMFSQHQTVQDCARWMMATLFRSDLFDPADPVTHLDVDALRTIDEAQTVLLRIVKEAEETRNQKLYSRPVAQPEGLIAFANANSVGLHRYWREFAPRDLYPQGHAPSGLRTLVTIDEIEDGWHVCFMQDWDSPGVSVTNAIDRLATAFFREANAIAEQQVQNGGKKGLRAWFARGTRHKHAPLLDPDRFHFYQHIPPTAHSKEDFDRVTLRFENGGYQNPEWTSFKSVPAIIQSAREYLQKSEYAQEGMLQMPMIGSGR